MKTEKLAGVVRHVLTYIAGALGAAGVLSEDETQVLASLIAQAIGMGWSWWSKRKET